MIAHVALEKLKKTTRFQLFFLVWDSTFHVAQSIKILDRHLAAKSEHMVINTRSRPISIFDMIEEKEQGRGGEGGWGNFM